MRLGNREETPKQKPYRVGVKCLFIYLVYQWIYSEPFIEAAPPIGVVSRTNGESGAGEYSRIGGKASGRILFVISEV